MKDSRMKKCYDTMFLLVLKDYILLNPNCRERIASADWTGRKTLKKFFFSNYLSYFRTI